MQVVPHSSVPAVGVQSMTSEAQGSCSVKLGASPSQSEQDSWHCWTEQPLQVAV
jgi:hypothetical protein